MEKSEEYVALGVSGTAVDVVACAGAGVVEEVVVGWLVVVVVGIGVVDVVVVVVVPIVGVVVVAPEGAEEDSSLKSILQHAGCHLVFSFENGKDRNESGLYPCFGGMLYIERIQPTNTGHRFAAVFFFPVLG